jgi:hypothetical protein
MAMGITNHSLAAEDNTSHTVELQWAICDQKPEDLATQWLQHNTGERSELVKSDLSYIDTQDHFLYSKDVQIKIESERIRTGEDNKNKSYKVSVKVNKFKSSSLYQNSCLTDSVVNSTIKCEWDIYPDSNGTQKYACKLNNTINDLNGQLFSKEQVDFVQSETGIHLMDLQLQTINWLHYEELTLKLVDNKEPITISSIITNDGTPITEASFRTTLQEKSNNILQMNKILSKSNASLCSIQQGKLSRLIESILF